MISRKRPWASWKRAAEAEKVGQIYKILLRDLPEDLDAYNAYKAVIVRLRDERIFELEKENKRLLEREVNLTSQSFVQRQIATNSKEPELVRAHDALSRGHTDEALKILRELSRKNPAYDKQLLSGLVMSKKPEDWEQAEKLLPEFGTLEHYNRLSLAFWANNDLTKAISLGEHGLARILERKGEKAEEPIVIAKAKNSLAYYYADAELEDKADDARKLVEDALRVSESEKNHEQYAKCLDTRGYIKITFGTNKEEIADGIRDCEEARRRGDDALYFKHISRAHKCLLSLADVSATTQGYG